MMEVVEWVAAATMDTAEAAEAVLAAAKTARFAAMPVPRH